MRVIAGTAKGRRLVAPPGADVRPTADRTKEALFSILQPDLPGASVLDLYAGSGALAIEALSRGAARATLIEKARRALDAVQRNLAETGLGTRADVVRGDVLTALESGPPGTPYDVIVADPPYAIDRAMLLRVLTAAVRHARDGAVVSVELDVHGDEPRWPTDVLLDEPRRYGDTVLHVGRVTGGPPRSQGSS